jgi:hypothetical protein
MTLLMRPILGGPFGCGQYALASRASVLHGLHSLEFMVISATGVILSTAEDKVSALVAARTALRQAPLLPHACNDEHFALQADLWPDEHPGALPPPRQVSRRRRSIFSRTGGRCFYCSCELDLQGPWHVEHQFPRALGGADDGLNLVAACVRCNLRKRDRTALEFFLDGWAPT